MVTNRVFSQKLTTVSASILLAIAAGACSLAIDTEPKGVGLGEVCAAGTECHAGSCQDGVCVSPCTADPDCPDPLKCRGGICQSTLKVRGMWLGSIGMSEGWTQTHHDGITASIQKLPYVDFGFAQNILIDTDAYKKIDEWAAEGANVIIANSFSQQEFIDKKQSQYPNIKFLIATGTPKAPNRASFFGHMEQAIYVAGKIAASKSKENRLGYIVSFITPETIRHINAFTLGARAVKSDIKVEVRYAGFWSDWNSVPTFSFTGKNRFKKGETLASLNAEEYLAAKLIDSGCDVIAHQLDNQRVGRFVEDQFKNGTLADGVTPKVWVIGNDNKQAWRDFRVNKVDGVGMTSSIGAAYWNWEPFYTALLAKIQHKQFQPIDINEPMSEDPTKRVISFDPNPDSIVNLDPDNVEKMLSEQARKPYTAVYQGPWDTTTSAEGKTQRPSQPAGETVSDADWGMMCWYVKGIVERSNSEEPTSLDQDAMVPTFAFPAPKELHTNKAPEIALSIPGLERGIAWQCDPWNAPAQ